MTAFGINLLDIIFVAIIVIFAVRGLMHGLIEEGATFLGFALGFVLCNYFLHDVTAFLDNYVTSPTASIVIAYLLLFILALTAAYLFGKLLRKVLVVSAAKWLDYMAGGVLGAAKGLLICLLIYLGFQFIAPYSELLQGSTMAPHLSELLGKIGEWLPNLTPESGGSWLDSVGI